MYGEDVELCMRANKKGVELHYFSTPKLAHLGQGSGASKNAILGEYQGLIYIFQKHKSGLQLSFLKFMLKLGAFLRVVLFGMIIQDEERKQIYQQALKLDR